MLIAQLWTPQRVRETGVSYEEGNSMSVNKNTYIICGYDLSNRYSEIMTEELCESQQYEEMVCNQRTGEIQFFDDPMYGDHLYVGFIIGGMGDDNGDDCIKIGANNTRIMKDAVDNQLSAWGIQTGSAPFELMVFNEFS